MADAEAMKHAVTAKAAAARMKAAPLKGAENREAIRFF
jgi:hypothetical protein